MLLLYVSLLVVLVCVQTLLRWRAGSLERRFVRVAAAADELSRQVAQRPGNANKPDVLVTAKQQYELACLAVKRDRVEQRYTAWQSLTEKVARLRTGLTGYQGKLLPYLLGVCDVAGVMVMLDRFGVRLADLPGMFGL